MDDFDLLLELLGNLRIDITGDGTDPILLGVLGGTSSSVGMNEHHRTMRAGELR